MFSFLLLNLTHTHLITFTNIEIEKLNNYNFWICIYTLWLWIQHLYFFNKYKFSLSVMSNFTTPQTVARQASLSITNSWSLLKLTSIKAVIQSKQLILCQPLLLLPSIFPSIRIFSNESDLCIRWSNTGDSASVLSMNIEDWFTLGLTGLISFAGHWTLKSLL